VDLREMFWSYASYLIPDTPMRRLGSGMISEFAAY